MYRCDKCKEKFLGEELSEWRNEKEEFSMHPFICPDCYNRVRRIDLEGQFNELLGGDNECHA